MYFVLRYGKEIFKFKVVLVLFELLNLGTILGSLYFGFIADVNSKWYVMIDQMITGRLSVVKRCITESGFHLFGSPMGGKICGYGIFVQPVSGYVTELGFPRMLLEYGPIIVIAVSLILLAATWGMHQVTNYEGMIFLGVCSLSFMVEAYYPAAYNPLPFIMGYGFFQWSKRFNRKREKYEESSEE